MTIRVYWRDANLYGESDFVRCDEFSLDDVLALIELTKKVDYVKLVTEELEEPRDFAWSELVLGSPDTKQVDRVDIYLKEASF